MCIDVATPVLDRDIEIRHDVLLEAGQAGVSGCRNRPPDDTRSRNGLISDFCDAARRICIPSRRDHPPAANDGRGS